jgi:membrane protein required for colicin V production
MNLVDLTVLGIVGISALLGLSRGFVREMLGLAAWLLAGAGAYQYGPTFIDSATRITNDPTIADIIAYAGTFLVLVVVMSLLSNLVGRMVRLSALGGLDRTLGLVFGCVRGAAVVVALYILGGAILPHPEAWPPQVKQARTIPLLYQGALWVAQFLHDPYRPNIPAPPEDRPTTSADLLQVSPAGSPLGRPPVRN